MIRREDLDALFKWAKLYQLALFPIPAWCKRPTGIVASHSDDWSRDPNQWRWWYENAKGCNFGVECGPSNLIVVDVDLGGEQACVEAFGSDILALATVNTPTGGKHIYFGVPLGINAGELRQPNLAGPKVNVRAGRGYVVSPFSQTHRRYDSGVKADGLYSLNSGGFGLAPPFLLEHCSPHRQDAPIIVARDIDLDPQNGWPVDPFERDEAAHRARALLSRLEASVPGERNEQLNIAAFGLGKLVSEGMMAEWLVVEMLQDSGEKIGIARDEAKARSTIRSGLKAAPKVGQREPRSAMAQLLACAVPMAPVKPPIEREPPRPTSLVPVEPLVERLLYPGAITMLSGHSGTGKTSLMAALMAASTGDVSDYQFGEFGIAASDLMMQPCCWIFVSYEGGQYMKRTAAAWHVGTGVDAKFDDRCDMIDFDDGPLVSSDSRRTVVVNEAQGKIIGAAIDAMKARYPDTPLCLVVDNSTAAIENSMDSVQAQTFSRLIRVIARKGISVVVLAHPPKQGHSDIYGSHLLYSLGDIVATIEVLTKNNGEWVQWVEFSKHRPAPNDQCLEIRSRRIDKPLVELPPEWGRNNQRARQRQLEELRVPFVSSIRIRQQRERKSIENGVEVVGEVTAKPAANMGVV